MFVSVTKLGDKTSDICTHPLPLPGGEESPVGERQPPTQCYLFCFFMYIWAYSRRMSTPPLGFVYTQFCSFHATQVDGVLPGRSNRQQSPAGPVNMRRNMRRCSL